MALNNDSTPHTTHSHMIANFNTFTQSSVTEWHAVTANSKFQNDGFPHHHTTPLPNLSDHARCGVDCSSLQAVTIHNFPEGLAVGVGFGAIGTSKAATFASARNLAIGIGIQNFPEGLAVSLRLHRAGFSKPRAFFYGQLSGMVEPVAGLLGAVAVKVATPLLPYALAFAAGAMVYVVLDSIVPDYQVCQCLIYLCVCVCVCVCLCVCVCVACAYVAATSADPSLLEFVQIQDPKYVSVFVLTPIRMCDSCNRGSQRANGVRAFISRTRETPRWRHGVLFLGSL